MAQDKKGKKKDVKIKNLPPKKMKPGQDKDVTGGMMSAPRTKETNTEPSPFETTTWTGAGADKVIQPAG